MFLVRGGRGEWSQDPLSTMMNDQKIYSDKFDPISLWLKIVSVSKLNSYVENRGKKKKKLLKVGNFICNCFWDVNLFLSPDNIENNYSCREHF